MEDPLNSDCSLAWLAARKSAVGAPSGAKFAAEAAPTKSFLSTGCVFDDLGCVKAAEIKASHRGSLADAWIAACALLRGATLLHKDPQFETIRLSQEPLPYRNKNI
jgi:hypothetical protein